MKSENQVKLWSPKTKVKKQEYSKGWSKKDSLCNGLKVPENRKELKHILCKWSLKHHRKTVWFLKIFKEAKLHWRVTIRNK